MSVSLLAMLTALALHNLPGAPMTEAIDILMSASLWAAVLRIATPLIFGVLGALICERAGVLNLGIEGIMTVGAMVGWLAVYLGRGPLDRPAGGGGGGDAARAAACAADRVLGPVAACVGPWDHAFRLVACRTTSTGCGSRSAICRPRSSPFQPLDIPGLSDLPFVGEVLFSPDGPHLPGAAGGRGRRLGPGAHAAGPGAADDGRKPPRGRGTGPEPAGDPHRRGGGRVRADGAGRGLPDAWPPSTASSRPWCRGGAGSASRW